MSIDLEKRTTIAAKVDCSVTPIPASFDYTDAASLILSGLSNVKHITVYNYTTSILKFAIKTGNNDANPTQVDFYCPAGTTSVPTTLVFDDIQVEGHVFVASDEGAAISVGALRVNVF